MAKYINNTIVNTKTAFSLPGESQSELIGNKIINSEKAVEERDPKQSIIWDIFRKNDSEFKTLKSIAKQINQSSLTSDQKNQLLTELEQVITSSNEDEASLRWKNFKNGLWSWSIVISQNLLSSGILEIIRRINH